MRSLALRCGCATALRPARRRSGRPDANGRGPPARSIALDRIERRARARSIRASSRSISFGVGRSPRSRILSASSRCSAWRSLANCSRSGSAESGAGTRSSRWNVPPSAAAARSAVIAETMLPAAPVIRNTRAVVGLSGRVVLGRRDGRRDRPAQSVGVADLDGPGSRSVSSISVSAVVAGVACWTEIDDLHVRVRPLLGERLGEAADRAAEHAACAPAAS